MHMEEMPLPPVQVEQSASGWTIHNGHVRLEILRTSSGGVVLGSLRHEGTGYEWTALDSPTGPSMQWEGGAPAGLAGDHGLSLQGGVVRPLPSGGMELILSFGTASSDLMLLLELRCYPGVAVVEYAALLENRGSETLPLVSWVDPLCLCLRRNGTDLHPYSADPGGAHGFHVTDPLGDEHVFADWAVLEDQHAGQSLLVGGDLGAGVLRWQAVASQTPNGTLLRAGVRAPRPAAGGSAPAYELRPGEQVQMPISFLALAAGDPDDAGNEAWRYLKRYIFPKPVANTPQATYCLWFTDDAAEELLLEELAFARRVGFDVLYHD